MTQLDERPAPRDDRAPVDRHPVDVQRCDGRDDRFGIRALAMESSERQSFAIASGEARADRGDQRRMRSELEERVAAGIDRLVDRPLEQHGLAHVAAPVVGVELLTVDGRSRDAREHRNSHGLRPQSTKAVAELAGERIHLVAVECVVDAQDLTQHIRLLAADLGDELIEQGTRTGDADELRAVDRGNLKLSIEFFEVVAHATSSKPDRGHAALPPCPLLQPAAVIDDIHRLRQRERAGDVSGGDFADAVPDHRLGPDAPRRQPLGKRHLQREYRRLGDDGLVDARAVLQSRQLLEQRPSGALREEPVAGLHGLPEQRIVLQQPRPMPHHWAPCPVNTNASRRPLALRPDITAWDVSPAANPRSALAAASADSAATTNR